MDERVGGVDRRSCDEMLRRGYAAGQAKYGQLALTEEQYADRVVAAERRRDGAPRKHGES